VSEEHELDIDASPATVSGVRDDLHRMVLNLLENAVRHTPAGTRISASTRSSNGDVVLVVKDSGPGIAPELAPRVFERFVRGGGDGAKGSGLGLSIVRAVAESHGGTVRLASAEDGSGTCFEVTLPAAMPDAGENGSEEPVGERAQNGHSAPVYTSTTTGSTIGRRRRRS
jgi:signal transduction histidine kinase